MPLAKNGRNIADFIQVANSRLPDAKAKLHKTKRSTVELSFFQTGKSSDGDLTKALPPNT